MATKGRLSLYALSLICAATIGVRCSFPHRQVLAWDVFGYYLYLPATLIHDDLALEDHPWLDEVMTTYEPSSTLYQLVDGPDGNRVIKYSSGMAVLYAPFFLVAHMLADPLGYTADGFSAPYQIAITIGCLAFALFGLVLFRNMLLHFFDDRWTAALLLLIGLGTNWFQLTAWDGTLLTHSALFTLYALLLLATIRWHAAPSWRWALWIGVSLGLMTLIRPSELVAVLIPKLWGLHDAHARKAKWNAVRNNIPQILGAAVLFLIAVSPQVFYWKATTGRWIFYSYVNPGEGFDLATPHLRPFLVSFRKGWFIYTPLMLIAMGGIIFLRKRIPQAFGALLVFLIVDLWIVSSWSCWWYAGGSFSSRSMVPAYVLLALPLGVALQWAWERKMTRIAALVACSAFVVLNLFQTWQWTAGIISKERMTKAYYKAVFARTSIPDGAKDLLLVKRSFGSEEHLDDASKYYMREVFRDDFHDRPDSILTLTAEAPYSQAFETTFEGLTNKDHVWIRATAKFWVGDTTSAPPTMVIHFDHEGGTYKYLARDWVIPAQAKNEWISFSVDYITPEVRSVHDRIKVYIWNQRGTPMRVDGLVVQVFEPK
ncbi:MAG: hypothetical protein JNM62_00840 [Flavobacteriales bacterium]|nr:hypothetical protein [Flavobacteriales bacterium]